MPFSKWGFLREATKRALHSAWDFSHGVHILTVLGLGLFVFLGIHFEEHPLIWLPFAALLIAFFVRLLDHTYYIYREAESTRKAIEDKLDHERVEREVELKKVREDAMTTLAALTRKFDAERAELQAKLDNRSRRVAIRNQLGVFLTEGQQLMGACVNEYEPSPEQLANEWAGRVEVFFEREFRRSLYSSVPKWRWNISPGTNFDFFANSSLSAIMERSPCFGHQSGTIPGRDGGESLKRNPSKSPPPAGFLGQDPRRQQR
jgi:hypothetical protein